jgi:eukaryotic-like serine/threonine-protein kinase
MSGSFAARSWVGTTVGGRYSLEEIVEDTATTTTFHAVDTRVGRQVAVRVLRPGLGASSAAGRRLEREARMSAAIGHPNVREASDLGALEDGTPFVVTELLAGETLDEAIRVQGAHPIGAALDLTLQILSGLSAAHAKGLVHGALRPEHVFLVRRLGCSPLVKLTAFGEDLSAPLSERAGPGAHYLAPEQIRGGNVATDARSDVYAAGVIAYELLTGMRPFTAPDAASLFEEILGAPLRDPRALRHDVAPTVADLVHHAMRRDPRERFPSAEDMQRAIRAAQAQADSDGTYSLRTVLTTGEYDAVAPSRLRTSQKTVESWDDETEVASGEHAPLSSAGEQTVTIVRPR